MVLKCAAVSESESERSVDAPRPDSKSQKEPGIYDGPQVVLTIVRGRGRTINLRSFSWLSENLQDCSPVGW